MNKTDERIVRIFQEHINRIMDMRLHIKDPGRGDIARQPFFTMFRLKDLTSSRIRVQDGALSMFMNEDVPQRLFSGEMRLGDYEQGGSREELCIDIPREINELTISREVWRHANDALYDASKTLGSYINESLGIPKEFQPFVYFSREDKVEHYKHKPRTRVDYRYWIRILKEASKMMTRKDIRDSNISLDHHYEKRFIVNSEGTVIVDFYERFYLRVCANILCKDNLVYPGVDAFNTIDYKKMPTKRQLSAWIDAFLKNLYEIKDAGQEPAGTFPTVVDGENFGVIWHESFGHSAEGGRQDESDEEADFWDCEDDPCLTLKDKLGERIAPEFMSVYDDPTVAGMDGSYLYDDEGVRGQKVCLIENGVLRNYLTSRESAAKFAVLLNRPQSSNGHARGDEHAKFLEPRMSNLIIRSENEKSKDELIALMIEECEAKGKKYGLMLEKTSGGFTDSAFSFFHTHPLNIFRIYPSGKKERVKGLYMVGTPLQILENIVATSNDYQVFNGTCGAGSGWVPSTQTAPDAFIRNVEFGRIPRSEYEKFLKPVYPPPLE